MLKRGDPAFDELLEDISNVVSSRYVENPHAAYSPLYTRAGKGEFGVNFESLGRGDQTDILTELIAWGDYRDQGVSDGQLHAIFENVLDGKWPHRWFDGVFDRTPEREAFQKLLRGDAPMQERQRTQERGGREM